MKKLLTKLLIVLLAIGILFAFVACGETHNGGDKPDGTEEPSETDDTEQDDGSPTEGLEFSLDKRTDTYKVKGIGTATKKYIVIPAVYEGKAVTSIGDNAFPHCNMKGITIPNSVTLIGSSAFAFCSSLTNISIPDSVTGIGEFAFDACSSLTSISIPNRESISDLHPTNSY